MVAKIAMMAMTTRSFAKGECAFHENPWVDTPWGYIL